jgi:hypothetical protein
MITCTRVARPFAPTPSAPPLYTARAAGARLPLRC